MNNAESSGRTSKPQRFMPRKLRNAAVVAVLTFTAFAAWGITTRMHANDELERHTGQAATPLVAVLAVKQDETAQNIALPGSVRAFAESPVYARSSGYLKRWLVDIGDKVKAGQLLAEIDAPEIDQQLRQAQATLASGEAQEKLARSTDRRWRGLVADNSVSRQEADEKAGEYAAQRQMTEAARADVQRLRDLKNFQRVVAPFAGTITARHTETGHLIVADNSLLFNIADTSKMRIYVQVPQAYASVIKTDTQAEVHFADHPGHNWKATVVRNADALDPATRTLQIELQLDNSEHQIFAGTSAEVRLNLPSANAIHVPANALIFRGEGLLVATVDGEQKIKLKPIQPGRDFGTDIEVLDGLAAGDHIVINPPDSLIQDQQVRVAESKEGKP